MEQLPTLTWGMISFCPGWTTEEESPPLEYTMDGTATNTHLGNDPLLSRVDNWRGIPSLEYTMDGTATNTHPGNDLLLSRVDN